MRADKFHHRERLKKARRRYWGRDLTHEPKNLARAVNTPKGCSCWMCNKPRNIMGLNMQERRELIEWNQYRRNGE